MFRSAPRVLAIIILLVSGSIETAAEQNSNVQLLKGKAAFGGWQQDKPGVRRLLTPQDLPAVSKPTESYAEIVSMPAGAKPSVPAGFSADMVASGLAQPRVIRVAPNGDLFVADSAANTVRVFRIPAGSAKPTNNEIFASGLHEPYGIAFYPLGPNPEWAYIANTDGVVRYPYKSGDLTVTGKPEKIVERIP